MAESGRWLSCWGAEAGVYLCLGYNTLSSRGGESHIGPLHLPHKYPLCRVGQAASEAAVVGSRSVMRGAAVLPLYGGIHYCYTGARRRGRCSEICI